MAKKMKTPSLQPATTRPPLLIYSAKERSQVAFAQNDSRGATRSGENNDMTLKMPCLTQTAALRRQRSDSDDLREAVTTLEDAERTARRVLGGAHPLTSQLNFLRSARAALGAREAAKSRVFRQSTPSRRWGGARGATTRRRTEDEQAAANGLDEGGMGTQSYTVAAPARNFSDDVCSKTICWNSPASTVSLSTNRSTSTCINSLLSDKVL